MHHFRPQVLKYDVRTRCAGYAAINFGASKGMTFDRVLIFPNGKLTELLQTGDPCVIESPSKYYVAITRAKYSLAFAYDGVSKLANINPFRN
jgi:DNA helicase-2/ATP-dependent DNA helicase PcrA